MPRYASKKDGVLLVCETSIVNDFLESLAFYFAVVRYGQKYMGVVRMGENYVIAFNPEVPPKALEYLLMLLTASQR